VDPPPDGRLQHTIRDKEKTRAIMPCAQQLRRQTFPGFFMGKYGPIVVDKNAPDRYNPFRSRILPMGIAPDKHHSSDVFYWRDRGGTLIDSRKNRGIGGRKYKPVIVRGITDSA
jgi:hypothetical protein